MLFLAFLSISSVRFTAGRGISDGFECRGAVLLAGFAATWWTVVAEISGKHGAAMFGLMNGLGGLGVGDELLVGTSSMAAARGFSLVECWGPCSMASGWAWLAGRCAGWWWMRRGRLLSEQSRTGVNSNIRV